VSRQSFPLRTALAIYACAFLVIAWPWLSGAVTIPWDAKAQFYPQQAFLAHALAEGQSPFWTPNVFAGWPQIADPQSLIFSPLHFLLALFVSAPGLQAFDAVTFAALFLGGVGMILFFRDRGWHAAGALVAALAFAFGGSCAARIQHTGEILSVAYLPLALWLLLRALEKSSWRAGAAAGLMGGLIGLGRDQVALIALYLLVALVVAHWLSGERRLARIRASLRPLAAGCAVGVAIVAVPMLMTMLLAAESNRPAIDLIDAGRGSLHPGHLLTLVFPDLFGAANPTVRYWGPSSIPWGFTGLFLAQNMGELYTGAIPLVAILGLGIAGGALWRRDIRFFSIAAAVVLLYALGWYTPAFRAMYEVFPGVPLFRRPADATFVFGALVALLAGYCVHVWLSRPATPSRWQSVLALILAASLVTAALWLANSIGTINVAAWPILGGIAWTAAALLALVAARHLSAWSLAATVLLAAFVTVDLRWNNAPNESTGLPPATYEALRPDTQDETVKLLKSLVAAAATSDRRARVELTAIGYHWPNLSLAQGLEDLFGQNPLRLREFALATGVGDTVAVADQRKFAPLFPSYRSALADLFGLRFIVTGVPVEQIDPKLVPGDLALIDRTRDAYVYENPRALPRAMLLTDWRQADFGALLRNGWPADVDPRSTALLEQPPQGLSPSSARAGGGVRIARYENTRVVIEVEAPDGGLLLLNDVWHPWWRADADGADAKILKANVLFRAVALKPGRHVVTFTFHPFTGAMRQVAERLGFSR
jgi:hypothetical protein